MECYYNNAFSVNSKFTLGGKYVIVPLKRTKLYGLYIMKYVTIDDYGDPHLISEEFFIDNFYNPKEEN